MCGLVGAFRADSTKFDKTITDFMEKGLFVSAMRGTHGTGVGIVNQDFEVGHVKSQIDSPSFLQTAQWDWAKKEIPDARVILGHTRHSTITGSVSAKNAHPFHWRVGNEELILTHNGHISNAWSLTPANWNHPVDSAHVAYALLREKDPIAVLEKLSGFWALAWFDSRDNTFKITRNHTRDLYYAYSPDRTCIYYASEAEMLHFVCERENIKLANEEYHEIEPAQMLVWDLSKKTLEDPVKVGYEEKKAASSWQEAPWQATVGRSVHGQGTSMTKNTTTSTGGFSRNNSMSKSRANPQGHADISDMIYVAVEDWGTFEMYRHTGPDRAVSPFDWGHLTGTRRMDAGSTVQIDSVQRHVMEKVLKFIGDGIPCIVDKVVNIVEEGKTKRIEYNVRLDQPRVMIELRRAIIAATNKRNVDPHNGPTLPNESTMQEARRLLNIPVMSSVPGDRLVEGPEGAISLKDWMTIAELNCMMCDGQIIVPDVGKVKFYDWERDPQDRGGEKDYQMICPTCCAGMDKTKVIVNPSPTTHPEKTLQ